MKKKDDGFESLLYVTINRRRREHEREGTQVTFSITDVIQWLNADLFLTKDPNDYKFRNKVARTIQQWRYKIDLSHEMQRNEKISPENAWKETLNRNLGMLYLISEGGGLYIIPSFIEKQAYDNKQFQGKIKGVKTVLGRARKYRETLRIPARMNDLMLRFQEEMPRLPEESVSDTIGMLSLLFTMLGGRMVRRTEYHWRRSSDQD